MEHQQPIVRQIVQRTEPPDTAEPGSLADKVRVIGARFWAPHDEAGAPAGIEASMLPPTTALVRDFPVAGLDESWLKHLDQRIVRHPRDLLSHVRRILLLCELKRSDSIAGALLDLFIALGAHGRALRSRLLYIVEPEITPAQYAFFRTHLDDGVSPTDPMPLLPRSRLSRQVEGTTRIVRTRVSDSAREVAGQALASGHDDTAQQLLEDLLELDPGDPEVCRDLLELYERTERREDFFRTYTRFLGLELGESPRWRRLAAKFRGASDPADKLDSNMLPDLAWLR